LISLLSEVEGSAGAALVGVDGIPIESESSDADMVTLAAEYAALLADAQRAADDLKLGETRRLSVVTDRMNLFFSLLKSDCFLALAARNRGNWGKIRHKLEAQARKLEEEM
jgi:predicted regulator of Ras-like GTPase activity (Roadblock/LC7/MglB family)